MATYEECKAELGRQLRNREGVRLFCERWHIGPASNNRWETDEQYVTGNIEYIVDQAHRSGTLNRLSLHLGLPTDPEAARRMAAAGNQGKYKVAVVAALVGSLLTFTLPLLYNRIVRGPKVIDQDPRVILDWYKSFENEAAAQLTAKELYYGKYVAAKGRITQIGTSLNSPRSTVSIDPVVCFVDFADAAGLREGQLVKVVGRISAITGGGGCIQLYDCRFRVIHERRESDLP